MTDTDVSGREPARESFLGGLRGRATRESQALARDRAVLRAEQGGVRLRTLVLIRWAAVAGQALTAGIVHWGLNFTLPEGPVAGAIVVSALLNLAFSFGRSGAVRLSDREAAAFLAFDIAQLSVLLFYTGGLANPFALLLLAPIAVAAPILSLTSTLALSLLTIAAVTVIGLDSRPLPWSDGAPPSFPGIYQVGVWVGLALTTLLITLYAWRLAEEQRQLNEALAAANAALAREQRVSALGALAANAAHELGTPLSTIAVVVHDLNGAMARELEADDPWLEDVKLLEAETARCREILKRLTVEPTTDVSDAYTLAPLPALIEDAAREWSEGSVDVVCTAGPATPEAPPTAPVQVRSPEIVQGIGNLVHNATQFARSGVRLHTRWTQTWVETEISDDGPGFPAALLAELGTPFVSTRQGADGHMGLGVFIAKTLLERTGATVSFANAPIAQGGGARIAVRWKNPTFKVE
jgi:two-component system sensor histidine kinase RegB